MAVVTKTLRMVFRNQAGSSFTMTLDNPRDNLTTAEIEAFMDQLIAANILTTPGGDLASKYDIKIIDQSVNDLYDPA